MRRRAKCRRERNPQIAWRLALLRVALRRPSERSDFPAGGCVRQAMRSSLRPKVIAVTCLAFEARIAAATASVNILCSARSNSLARLIETAIAQDCGGIISFGVAGGLDPRLRPGDWVVASQVVTNSTRYPTDASWSRRICDALPSPGHGSISGVDEPIARPADKARLHELHGSLAADTESHVAARMAAARGIPFAAARVVLDPAHRALPPAALLPLCPDGSPDLRAIARSVRIAPGQIRALSRLAVEAICAQSALLLGTRCLGESLGFEGCQTLEPAGSEGELALTDGELPARSA